MPRAPHPARASVTFLVMSLGLLLTLTTLGDATHAIVGQCGAALSGLAFVVVMIKWSREGDTPVLEPLFPVLSAGCFLLEIYLPYTVRRIVLMVLCGANAVGVVYAFWRCCHLEKTAEWCKPLPLGDARPVPLDKSFQLPLESTPLATEKTNTTTNTTTNTNTNPGKQEGADMPPPYKNADDEEARIGG